MAAPPNANVLVIGGGISGLACAWRLRQQGISVQLLERAPHFGGVIGAVEKDGFLFDTGPQSFPATPAITALIEELGLAGELLRADAHAPRFIFLRGRLVPVPFSPPALLRTPLAGWRTKARLLTEPLRSTHPPEVDESMAAFVRRKFGQDLLANLVAPFVSGVYAGDPEKLSLRSAFPAVHQLEQEYGSVLRGAIKSRRKGKAAGSARGEGGAPASCNFKRGIATLVDALAQKLGTAARSGAEVAMIRAHAAAGAVSSGGFAVASVEGGVTQPLAASAIVIATPTWQAARLLAGVQPAFADLLLKIEYAGVAQISAGYRLSQITGPLARKPRGFGVLIPRTEGLRLLGAVFNSFLFAGRAPEQPEKMVSFTSFLGGATDPAICKRPEDTLAEIARTELAGILGITGPPVAEHVSRWERALPQYNLGHERIIAGLKTLCVETPGVFLAGNYLSGPSLGACIDQAAVTANEVAAYLAARA